MQAEDEGSESQTVPLPENGSAAGAATTSGPRTLTIKLRTIFGDERKYKDWKSETTATQTLYNVDDKGHGRTRATCACPRGRQAEGPRIELRH